MQQQSGTEQKRSEERKRQKVMDKWLKAKKEEEKRAKDSYKILADQHTVKRGYVHPAVCCY